MILPQADRCALHCFRT